MATGSYLAGRRRYGRPQGILWSENAGTLSGGLYVPVGQEIGADDSLTTGGVDQFLILSDHNRSEISIKPLRVEQRERMINGNMRSYHIADKNVISWNWTNLPSRAYSKPADFDANGKSPLKYANDLANNNFEFTADGGAGGAEILDWYRNHQGPFWMFLAYDNYPNFGKDAEDMNHMPEYNEIVKVYFTDFSYEVVKRGGGTTPRHDLWNISVTLEEE